MPLKMRLNTRPTLISFGLKTLSAAVASAVLLLSNAHAAGLGKLTVLSALGQPLRAEIELTSVTADEAAALVPKLAPAEAFRQVNIDFNPALLSLRFAIDQRGGRQYIRVTSAVPINEPFIDMLLELNSSSGRLVREYTFLLDPADLRTAQAPQVATPVAVPLPAATPTQPVAQAAKPPQRVQTDRPPADAPPKVAPVRKPVAESPSGTESTASEYKVQKGDTLGRIAGKFRSSGVSLDQMLVALYRANENAFIDNNMNRVRSGQILKVPDLDAARGISESEAKAVVLAQATDFSSYRNKLAGQVASAAPTKSAEPKQSAGGKITTKIEERPTAANASSDKLKLSNTIAGTPSAADLKAAAAAAEDRIVKDKIAAENVARVKELEKNIAELKRLAEIKNKNLADQAAAAAAKKPESKPLASVPPLQPMVAAASQAASVPAVAVTPKPKPKRPVPVPTPVAPKLSLMDLLMENLMSIMLAISAIVGIGALYMFYKRRKKPELKFDSSILDDSSMQTNSMFGSTGGQSVDTNNSVFNSNFAPSASQLDTNEVDPVAEADVYIAYGRDVQAEEILKEALRTQPERNAVRLKLLEIYATRKDTRSFEAQAGELYSMTDGDGDDWALAASMGIAIDPNNPLYAGHDVAAKPSPALHASTEPLDELDPEALLVSTQQPAHKEEKNPFAFDTPESKPAAVEEEEFDFNLDELVAAPVAPAAELVEIAKPVEAAVEEDHVLDFDLHGLSFDDVEAKPVLDKPAATEVVAPAVLVEAAPAMMSLEKFSERFDEVPMADMLAPVMDVPDMSFDAVHDMQFELPAEALLDIPVDASPEILPEIAFDEPVKPIADDADFNFDIDSMDFGVPDIDQGHAGDDATAAPAADKQDAAMTEDFFAAPHIDEIAEGEETILSMPKAEAEAEAEAGSMPVPTPVVQDFDLTGIDLDLNEAGGMADMKADDIEAFAVGDDPSADQMEMDTKLDLAVAYQEIGDKEGARELIDEVIKGGAPDQVEKAKAMRLTLA
jgi:pilus assembly protein FimV